MRRTALWLALGGLVVLGLEAAGWVGMRLVEGRWTTPWALRAERLATVVDPGSPVVEEPGEEPPYRLPWRPGGRREVLHPFLGFVHEAPGAHGEARDPLGLLGFWTDATPIPHPAAPEDFLVLVCGGSVAQGFEDLGGAAPLVERLATLPGVAGKRVHVGNAALSGFKQPQQLFALTYLLALGFRPDLIVNLDGFNEATLGAEENVKRRVAALFPRSWALRVEDTPDRRRQSILGEATYLRERRGRWGRWLERPVLRWSAAAGLLWTLADDRLERRLAVLERAFVEEAPDPGGWRIAPPPPSTAEPQALAREQAMIWRESSLQMDRLARANGLRYVHFLQPNQYVRGSKPMGERERAIAVLRHSPFERWVARVYPHLAAGGAELRKEGVAFFDLTRVFADVASPVYTDNCCHFSPDGYRILGAAMAEAIAGDWDRLGGPPRPPGSPPPAQLRAEPAGEGAGHVGT